MMERVSTTDDSMTSVGSTADGGLSMGSSLTTVDCSIASDTPVQQAIADQKGGYFEEDITSTLVEASNGIKGAPACLTLTCLPLCFEGTCNYHQISYHISKILT